MQRSDVVRSKIFFIAILRYFSKCAFSKHFCIFRYETSINEVSEELEAMRSRVAELLEENRKLPESERIDENEFELDVGEQQRRVNDGEDKEDDLRFELKAWQLARQKVGQKIRKKVWDDMEVKGRSINGMKVRNFFNFDLFFSFLSVNMTLLVPF